MNGDIIKIHRGDVNRMAPQCLVKVKSCIHPCRSTLETSRRAHTGISTRSSILWRQLDLLLEFEYDGSGTVEGDTITTQTDPPLECQIELS